jgi:hypothetical protein
MRVAMRALIAAASWMELIFNGLPVATSNLLESKKTDEHAIPQIATTAPRFNIPVNYRRFECVQMISGRRIRCRLSVPATLLAARPCCGAASA